jgi:two-component system chemotaxis response regulator CheB
MSDSNAPARSVHAIVIGASAGGIEALSVLLPALPAGLLASVFIVVHIPRDTPSMLQEVFAPRCALPVLEAEDKLPVLAGSVYFAPPDYHLLIDAGPHIALSTDELVNFSRPSIDVLFESAADIYGAGLLGILLTGANQDGAAGLEAVANAGGMTIVQDPATARSPQMPEAAIRRRLPDRVLTLDQIAQCLRSLHPAAA